jgi:hypothetical protein
MDGTPEGQKNEREYTKVRVKKVVSLRSSVFGEVKDSR